MNTPERLGYACINMGLSYPKKWGNNPKAEPVTTNRSMIKRTFQARGIDYASELCLKNVKDLHTIIAWNRENGFNFFRVSSNLFPWATEYKFEDLKDYDEICEWLGKAGALALRSDQRLTTHPGPFNKLTSPKEEIIQNTIKDLEIHGWLMDQLGMPLSPWSKINIHVGASYGDKDMACANFCKNFRRLSESVQARLTVENDDKPSLYTTVELYERIYKHIDTPIVFDYHHHKCHSDGMTEQDALSIACSTWDGITPVVHYSESRRREQLDESIKPQAHSDYVYDPILTYGHRVHCMVEAKHKELAVLRWRERYDKN